MIKIKHIFILFFVFTTIGFSFGQNVDFKGSNFKDDKEGFKKATEAIKKGDELLTLGTEAVFNVQDYKLNFKKALQYFQEAQKFNANNAELNYKIGVCYANSTDPFLSIAYFKRAKELDPKCNPFLNYYFGYAMQLEGNFDAALASYAAFENEYKKADSFSKFVLQRKKECAAAKKGIKSPVRAWVDNMNEINSEFDDIAPSISVDGAEMIMSSNRPNQNTANEVGGYDHDIYSTTLRDFNWNTPQRLRGAINSAGDDVTNTISYDGTKMLLHRLGVGDQTDIFESQLKGLEWSDPVMMSNQISSPRANEKYACYNDDGWKIYFTRDNENKSNGTEVMFSAMQSKIRKDYMGATMVSTVNSKFNEGPIYITVDGETMYIASEGFESMGGYDIFMSKKIQGQWSIPVNLG